MTSDITLIS